MFIFLLCEIVWWVALVQGFRYGGKIKESKIINGEEHELTKYYIETKKNWNIALWVSFVVQLLIIFF